MQRRQFLTAAGSLSATGLVPRFALAEAESPLPGHDAATRFAIDLYQQLRQRPGNLFVSPLSISVALAMTAAGAAGNTRTQMEQTLHLPAEDPGHQSIRQLIAAINAPHEQQPDRQRGFQLNLANAIYIQQGYTLRDAYRDVVTDSYGAGLENVDFAADADEVRQQINRWVRSQTQDKIEELFAPSSLDSLTRLVLANAIYFKGKWQAEFDPAQTRPEPFSRADGSSVDVPMMHREGDYKLLETPEFQLLQMPYQGAEASMLILLPRRIDGLPALEQKLTAADWSQWSDRLAEVSDLQLYIPQFKLQTEYTLNETLQEMGITDAFDDRRADFSGMVGDQPEGRLAISTVVHKAFCEVNEEGTEAAAATGVAIGVTAFVEPTVFRAGHPFLFAIRHHVTRSLLFVGRVSDPKA